MNRMKNVMFSCTLPPCSPTRKQTKIAREKERKKSLQKGKDRYNIVKGLAEGVDGISFESLLKRRHYLRARNNYLILEPFDDTEDYRKETTFLPLQDMWFEGYFAFESLLNPAHFIRRRGEKLRSPESDEVSLTSDLTTEDKGINELRELRILKKREPEDGGKSLPPWSSLDGIPRIAGGLCIATEIS
ncbi:hypothetical protein OS493_001741 [Desmophyllum pertusum]|uniref:Alpha-L-arabinofuranosidase B arabinose-binding domain-containing protein n=1 Tax=Desmophyllum pertusum TaxID=174260 RepID=A0A9X0CUT3_9CNID|nr:hypothetical protein OS493_001741 [Desmophyllum pertusum]